MQSNFEFDQLFVSEVLSLSLIHAFQVILAGGGGGGGRIRENDVLKTSTKVSKVSLRHWKKSTVYILWIYCVYKT